MSSLSLSTIIKEKDSFLVYNELVDSMYIYLLINAL